MVCVYGTEGRLAGVLSSGGGAWREAREQEGNGGDRLGGDDGLCLGGQERGSDSCQQGHSAGVQ